MEEQVRDFLTVLEGYRLAQEQRRQLVVGARLLMLIAGLVPWLAGDLFAACLTTAIRRAS